MPFAARCQPAAAPSTWHLRSTFERQAGNLQSASGTANAQARLQLLAITPAQPKLRSIVQQNVILTILVKLQTANPIKLNDRRTVNPAEDRLIQLLFKLRHAAAQEMGSRPHMQAGVIVRRLDPIDLGSLQKRNLPRALDREPLQRRRRISLMGESRLGTPKRTIESSIIKRLQEVVERTRLKGPQRILVISRNEDHRRGQLSPQHLQHIKPIA